MNLLESLLHEQDKLPTHKSRLQSDTPVEKLISSGLETKFATFYKTLFNTPMQSDSTLEETPEGNLTVEENSQTPNVLIAQSGTVIPETEKAKYIDFLKRNEKVMPKKYKDQKGKPTIAVGHLITPQENKTGIIYDIPFRKGLDSQQIDTILNKDLMAKEQSVAAYLKENHGVDFASLTPVKQVVLLDMHFNPGLNKFPKFVGAILNGDYETQGKEYKRFLTKGKKTYPLVLRNQTFHNEYVRHSMAEDIVKKRIGQGNLTFIPDLESIQERTNQIMSKYQVGGVIIPTYPATFPSGWTYSYLASPKYKERLTNQISQDVYLESKNFRKDLPESTRHDLAMYDQERLPKKVAEAVQTSLRNIKRGRTIISEENHTNYHDDSTGNIYVDSSMEALPHELSHRNPMLNTSSNLGHQYIDIFNKYIPRNATQETVKKKGADFMKLGSFPFAKAIYLRDLIQQIYDYSASTHDIDPEEVKADIYDLRYKLYKAGIYDARTQDFTKRHLTKAKELFKGHLLQRLFNAYSEDDLIHLMNIVAQNTPQESRIQYAQSGGKVSPKNDDTNQTDVQFGRYHWTARFNPAKINLGKGGSQTGIWSVPGIRALPLLQLLDAAGIVVQLVNREKEINNSANPEKARKAINAKEQQQRDYVSPNKSKFFKQYNYEV